MTGDSRSGRKALAIGALAVGLLLVAAASAAAADRYASPTGTGNPLGSCPEADPCPLTGAIASASPGDRVLLLDGTYTPGDTLYVNGMALVAAGPGRPLITGSGLRLLSTGADAVVRGINIHATNPGASLAAVAAEAGSLLDRVRVTATGTAVAAVTVHRGEIRNSYISRTRDGSAAGAAVLGGAGMLRNVTALELGSGGGAGVGMSGSFAIPDGGTLALVNTIARSASGEDIRINDDQAFDIFVNAAHSSYSTVVPPGDPALLIDGGGNQAQPPRLAPNGAQLAASPTIDAGRTSAARGGLDLAGRPRVSGAAVDIGAFERISNRFRFAKLIRNVRRGSARLRIRVPGPGAIRLRAGKDVRGARARVRGRGLVTLPVRARGAARRALARDGRVRVRARVTFNPIGGAPRARARAVALRKH